VVVAAFIAAASSHLLARRLIAAERQRLDQGLRAEQARLEARLSAESEAQRAQLAHDRLLRDLEEVRGRVDEVIDLGEAALSAICEARLTFNDGNQTATDEQLWQARQCLGQYGYKERRVRLRIGSEHAVVMVLSTYRERLQSFFSLVHESVSQGRPIALDAWNAAMAEVGAAQARVIDAGEAAFGARIAAAG
jgi:hypothetical protein